MNQVSRKRYSREFKEQAVELVKLGKPVREVAEELEVGANVLYRWVGKSARAGELGCDLRPVDGVETEASELRRLRREVANLKLENDILKKAAVILGTNRPPSAGR